MRGTAAVAFRKPRPRVTREDKKARRQKEKGIRELGQMGDKLGEYDGQRCQGCPLRTRCHRKKRGNREIEVSHRFIAYKQRAREKLTSDKGLEHRSRRPIEPEAVFGQMKNNMHYRRFRHFGKDKVTMDFAFFAIAFNIKKMAAMMAKPA